MVEREMTKKLDDDVKRLLDGSNFAHLSTLMEDGSPKVEPIWIGREGDYVLIATDRKTIKGQNLARDKRVALSIIDYENPYEQALIRGTVIEDRDDNDLKVLDVLALKYTGKPFPRRKWSSRVVYVVSADIARYYLSPLKHTPAAP